jgi:hypothetical protein
MGFVHPEEAMVIEELIILFQGLRDKERLAGSEIKTAVIIITFTTHDICG